MADEKFNSPLISSLVDSLTRIDQNTDVSAGTIVLLGKILVETAIAGSIELNNEADTELSETARDHLRQVYQCGDALYKLWHTHQS